MMKKNLFLYLAAAVSCLLSCSEQVELHKGADGALISLRSSTLDASLSSRAPFSGALDSDNPLVALVPAAVAVNSASAGYVDGLHALGTMTFSGVNDGTPVSYAGLLNSPLF